MTESEEKLKSLLMKLKEENEKVGLKGTFRKLRSWHPVPSLHGIVNKAEIVVFFSNALAFSVMQQMLAIWFLWFLCPF